MGIDSSNPIIVLLSLYGRLFCLLFTSFFSFRWHLRPNLDGHHLIRLPSTVLHWSKKKERPRFYFTFLGLCSMYRKICGKRLLGHNVKSHAEFGITSHQSHATVAQTSHHCHINATPCYQLQKFSMLSEKMLLYEDLWKANFNEICGYHK